MGWGEMKSATWLVMAQAVGPYLHCHTEHKGKPLISEQRRYTISLIFCKGHSDDCVENGLQWTKAEAHR